MGKRKLTPPEIVAIVLMTIAAIASIVGMVVALLDFSSSPWC